MARATHRNKYVAVHATSLDDFIATFEALAEQFRLWKATGVTYLGGAESDHAVFELPEGAPVPRGFRIDDDSAE